MVAQLQIIVVVVRVVQKQVNAVVNMATAQLMGMSVVMGLVASLLGTKFLDMVFSVVEMASNVVGIHRLRPMAIMDIFRAPMSVLSQLSCPLPILPLATVTAMATETATAMAMVMATAMAMVTATETEMEMATETETEMEMVTEMATEMATAVLGTGVTIFRCLLRQIHVVVRPITSAVMKIGLVVVVTA